MTPYGDENYAWGCLDIACQVTNLPGCSHKIGWACLLSNIDAGATTCPLCRTPWWFDLDPFETLIPVARRPALEAAWARLHRATLQMAQDFFWNRQGHLRQKSTDLLNDVRGVLQSVRVQNALTTLQNTHPGFLDERLYDRTQGIQEFYAYGNPFTFRNWQAPTRTIIRVVFDAVRSDNGRRLAEMVHQELLRGSRLRDIEDRWVAWYGEEDVRVFSRFLISILPDLRERQMKRAT